MILVVSFIVGYVIGTAIAHFIIIPWLDRKYWR